jgi:hypothetical protein
VSSLALALSRASFPVLRFLPLVGPILRPVRSGAPVQGFLPSAKRCLLVAGPASVPLTEAPLTGFRRLPRDSASTSRPRSSQRSLVVPRFDPASDSLSLFRFLGLTDSPLPARRPSRGSSKPFAVLRWRAGLLRVDENNQQQLYKELNHSNVLMASVMS